MNLTETSTFDSGIYQIETTDVVLGGAGAIANMQAQSLANRTTFLKDNLYRLKSVENIAANTALTSDDANILKGLTAADHVTITLPDVGTTKIGDYFPFTSVMPFLKCATIQTFGVQVIKYAINDERAKMYMYTGERLVLVSAGTYWLVHSCSGNFDSVGESFGARKQKGNTSILNGAIVSRITYARLWEFASSLTNGQQIVSDATWLAGLDGNINVYRGCFSYGDGISTFRLPDERGLFDRYLDLSRGLDIGRIHNYAGGLENDDNKEHDHFIVHNNQNDGGNNYITKGHLTGGNSGYDLYGSSLPPNFGKSSKAGGAESRPKNIGKIPLIKF